MSETIKAKGICLCGAVEVRVSSASTEVGACHCSMCRKWSGGPFLGLDCGSQVEIINEKHVSSFASSDWAERGFCKQCGTHLFYRMQNNGQYFIPVGLFDIEATLKFDHQIFIEQKPSYYDFANETTNMTGEEVFAQFSDE